MALGPNAFKALSLLVLFGLAGVSSALLYRVTDLGVLPFDSQTVQATGINDLGMVCGTTDNSGGPTFIWDRQSGLTRLGPDFNREMQGVTGRMNNRGQIVGWTEWFAHGHITGYQPFVWSHDTGYKILPTLNGYGIAVGINDLGQVVGYADGAPTKAWLWDSVGGDHRARRFTKWRSLAGF